MPAGVTIEKPDIDRTLPEAQPAPARRSETVDERLARHFEKASPLLWILFSLAYFLFAISAARRLFWYDELFTYYLTGFPFHKLWSALLAGVDQNGPVFYVLTSATRGLVNSPEIGIRIPGILGGWFMLLTVFLYVRKRCSAVYAWAAVLFLVNSHGAYYFNEGRPYGLIMAACALSFFAWQSAAEGKRRGLSLLLLACSLTLAALCHAYSILIYVPLGLGELARTIRQRKVDWAIWSVFVSSATAYVVYIPIVRGVHGSLKYTWATPDFGKIPETYGAIFGPAWLPLLAMLILLGCLSLLLPNSFSKSTTTTPFLPLHEAVALVTLVLLPFIGLGLGQFTGIFTGRYVIESVVGIAIVLAIVLYRAAGARAFFAVTMCLISLSWEVWNFAGTMNATRDQKRLPPIHESVALSSIYDLLPDVERSDLPLVVSSGLMFFEIDHYGSPQLVSRLHLLIDRQAAIAHTKVDLFDQGLPIMAEWFPLRGQLDHYGAFVATHPHFLVYGYWDSRQANDWLVDRLLRDGAEVNIVAKTDRLWKAPYWAAVIGDARDLYLLDVRTNR